MAWISAGYTGSSEIYWTSGLIVVILLSLLLEVVLHLVSLVIVLLKSISTANTGNTLVIFYVVNVCC